MMETGPITHHQRSLPHYQGRAGTIFYTGQFANRSPHVSRCFSPAKSNIKLALCPLLGLTTLTLRHCQKLFIRKQFFKNMVWTLELLPYNLVSFNTRLCFFFRDLCADTITCIVKKSEPIL